MRKFLFLSLTPLFLLLAAGGCSSPAPHIGTMLPLDETLWVPARVAGAAAPAADVRLIFETNGKLNGASGDNFFYGNYQLSPANGIAITPLFVTRRATGPNAAFDKAFLDALSEARFYRLDSLNLILLGASGETLAVFEGKIPAEHDLLSADRKTPQK